MAELIKAFAPAAHCKPGPEREAAHAERSAGRITEAGAAAPGQASSSQTAGKRKAEDSLLEQQQQQQHVETSTVAQQGSSAATSSNSYQAATTAAASQVAMLLTYKEPLDEQQIQQLLRLVLSGKCGMQQVLEGLQQRDDQQAFMAFSRAVIRERNTTTLLAALAADCGRLMQHFLQSLSSSDVETSAAAAEVFSEFTEVVHAEEFIVSVLETPQGIELLGRAVLPPNISVAAAEGARTVSERFSELVRAALDARPRELRDTSTKVVQQCLDLLDPGRQHMSGTSSNQQLPEGDSGRSSVLVALLLVTLARSNPQAMAALACTVELLLAAVATATAGTYKSLCLAGLWAVLELDCTDARFKLAQCDLAPLAGILAQQEPDVSLATSILRRVHGAVRPADLPRFCSQLAQAATSSSTAAGSLAALNMLFSFAYRDAHLEQALSHLDAVLCALVQLTCTTAWHSSEDAILIVEEGVYWLYIFANAPSTQPQLTATPQRIEQLAAVVLRVAIDSGSELRQSWHLSRLANVLMQHTGAPGLLTLQLDSAPLAETNFQLSGAGSCWLQAFGAILQSLQYDGVPKGEWIISDALGSVATLARWLGDVHRPATPAVTGTAAKAATFSLAELENLGDSHLLLQALLGWAGVQDSVQVAVRVAMKAFACLRLLMSIPAYAFAVAAQYQDWEATAKRLHSKIPAWISDEQQQVCVDDLAAVKKCIVDLQERIIATTAHAKSGLELALRDCALEHQKFRVDPDDRQRQLMLAVQLQRLAKAVAYDSKAQEVRVEIETRVKSQLNDSSG